MVLTVQANASISCIAGACSCAPQVQALEWLTKWGGAWLIRVLHAIAEEPLAAMDNNGGVPHAFNLCAQGGGAHAVA
jgi:hypothetical protein